MKNVKKNEYERSVMNLKKISIYNSYVRDNNEKREHIANELRKNGFQTQKNGELIIVIGGDGTFLSAVKKKIEDEPVFVALNAGNLGFFTEFEADDIQKLMQVLKRKQYFVEEIPLYEVHLHGKDGVHVEYFINEVKISQQEDQAIHMIMEVDGEVLFKVPADNMMISGYLGSTAHTLGAGGPLSFCKNTLNVVATNPIMNKAYPYRVYPAILPDTKKITVFPSTQKQRPFKIVCDSINVTGPLKEKGINYRYISIQKSEKKIKILRTKQYNRIRHIHQNLLNFEKGKE